MDARIIRGAAEVAGGGRSGQGEVCEPHQVEHGGAIAREEGQGEALKTGGGMGRHELGRALGSHIAHCRISPRRGSGLSLILGGWTLIFVHLYMSLLLYAHAV